MLSAANVTVMIQQLDRAVDFYTGTLRLTLGRRDGDDYAEIIAPGLTIGLHPTRPADATTAGGNLSIGFAVADLDAAISTLRAGDSSLEFTRQENDTNRFAFFRDPDGTPLYLYQPVGTVETTSTVS